LRLFARSAAETPNRLSVEFQDEFNEYQQDSLSLVDVEDARLMRQEVSAPATALGIANFDQAARILRRQLNKSVQGNLYVEFGTSVRGFGLAPGDLIAITYEKEGLSRQPFRIVRVAPALNYSTVMITAQYHDDAWYDGDGGVRHSGRRQPAFGIGIPRPLMGSALDSEGVPQFEVSERFRQSSDGSFAIALTVGFTAPGRPNLAAVGIPALSLTAAVETEGGSLRGRQTLYYALSGMDEHGNEGPLSFVVRAAIPDGSDSNSVELRHLSFSPKTETFRVYRGHSPSELVRIADGVEVGPSFLDTGLLPEQAFGPPDENYDHANFYWRLELQPEVVAAVRSPNSIGNDDLHMLLNENRGAVVRITRGAGAGQERLVTANDATTLTVSPTWDIVPDSSSRFVIAEASWRFGSLTSQGPAEFEIPNRRDAIVHILGRSANVHDQECAAELSPITRWKVGGAGTVAMDEDVPPLPIFGLIPAAKGGVDLAGIGFEDAKNTRTVSAGTLTLLYWNELDGAPSVVLGSGADAETEWIEVAAGHGLSAGDVLQIDDEVMAVHTVDGEAVKVERGAFVCQAVDHEAGALVYRLARRTYVVPFVRDFFGSPASGSHSFPIAIPDVRIAAAALFLTNERGDGPTSRVSFMNLSQAGIRTLSGGQFSMQLDGVLALQIDATPPLMVEDSHAVRDVNAVLRQKAAGEVKVRVRHDDVTYCELVIPAGANRAAVNGFELGPLRAKSELSLDVIGVPQWPDAFPGADLTVTLRM
jgi:hypothetical protein